MQSNHNQKILAITRTFLGMVLGERVVNPMSDISNEVDFRVQQLEEWPRIKKQPNLDAKEILVVKIRIKL